MRVTFYELLGNTPPVNLKATFRMYYAIFHAQHTQTMMLPCWQQQIPQTGKAVYVLNKLLRLIQIPQSKQYYMGLSMSKFGYFFTIIKQMQLHVNSVQGRWQLAFTGLVSLFHSCCLPGLWHRHNCPVKEQSAVGSSVFT